MKKSILSIVAIAMLTLLVASCGSSEKCPAYSQAPPAAETNA